MNQLIKNNIHLFSKLNYFLIIFLPISLLVGTLISNITIILICFLFIFDLIQRKNFFLLKDKNFFFLLIIYAYLILNSLFLSENTTESMTRAVGFLRFILLAYAIFFYLKIYKNNFLKYWVIIFIIVSFDILYEFVFGSNILGFSAQYSGRISSFTGDELKIGGFYFGFFAISLAYIYTYKKSLFYLFSITFLIIAFLIGEKSNLIKIFFLFLILNYFFMNRKQFIRIILIVILSISTILVVNINQDLRESFLGELPIIKQSRIILHSIYPKPFTVAKLENNKNFKEYFYSTRYYAHYSTAYEMLKKNILFGVGLKNFRYESYKKEYGQDGKLGGSTHPHQTHFELLSELGLIGYLLILMNFTYILFQQKKNLNPFKIIGISFILSTLIPLLPSGSFFTSYGATIFFINYSFLIYLNEISDKNQNDFKS